MAGVRSPLTVARHGHGAYDRVHPQQPQLILPTRPCPVCARGTSPRLRFYPQAPTPRTARATGDDIRSRGGVVQPSMWSDVCTSCGPRGSDLCTACAQLWMNPMPSVRQRWSRAGKGVDKRNLRSLGVSRHHGPPGVFAESQRTAGVVTVNTRRPEGHAAGNDHRVVRGRGGRLVETVRPSSGTAEGSAPASRSPTVYRPRAHHPAARREVVNANGSRASTA